MTVKLSDYGIHGPWIKARCVSCSQERSCLLFSIGPEDKETMCILCLVKDIEEGTHA